MLEVRNPGHCWIRQTPTEKPGGLEDDVYLSLSEFRQRCMVAVQQERGADLHAARVERSRLHGLYAWNPRKSFQIDRIIRSPANTIGAISPRQYWCRAANRLRW
jgi:hypothetical protein